MKKIDDIKLLDVKEYIIITDKMSTASKLFTDFIHFYDPLNILHINSQSLCVYTKDGSILFIKDDPKVHRGRHNCIWLTPLEFEEFAGTYRKNRADTIRTMNKVQKWIYNFKLKRHCKKCASINKHDIKPFLL